MRPFASSLIYSGLYCISLPERTLVVLDYVSV